MPSIFFAHRAQQFHCSSIIHRVLLTHALAFSASQFVHKKKFPRTYTSMHSWGFELTKLTYTRLEDNLLRYWGDRQYLPSTPRKSLSASPISPYLLALAFLFLLSFILFLPCTRRQTAPPLVLPQYPSIFSRLRYPISFQLAFCYFLPHSPISYSWQPLFWRILHFILPFQPSQFSYLFCVDALLVLLFIRYYSSYLSTLIVVSLKMLSSALLG